MVVLIERKLHQVDFKDWKNVPLTTLDDLQKTECGFVKVKGTPSSLLIVGAYHSPCYNTNRPSERGDIIILSHFIDDDVLCHYEIGDFREGMRIAQFLKRAEKKRKNIVIGGEYPGFISPYDTGHQITVNYLNL